MAQAADRMAAERSLMLMRMILASTADKKLYADLSREFMKVINGR